MRVTEKMLQDALLRNLANTAERLQELQKQVSSGRRINAPSDDPIMIRASLRYRHTLGMLEQYKHSAEFSQGWLSQTDTALDSIGNLIRQAKQLALEQATATQDPSTRESAAQQVAEMKEEIIRLINTQYQGKYIFGGTKTTTRVVETVDGKYIYQGNDEERFAQIGEQLNLSYNVTWRDAFGNTAEVQGASIGEGITEQTRIRDVVDGALASIRVINGDDINIRIDLTAAQTFGDLINILNASPAQITASINSQGTGLVIRSKVSGARLEIQNNGGDTTAERLGLVGSGEGSDLLAILSKLEDALSHNDMNSIGEAGNELDQALDHLLDTRARVGAKLRRIDMAVNWIDDLRLVTEDLLAKAEDADITEVVTQLTTQQSLFQAALAVTARMILPSLADFMR